MSNANARPRMSSPSRLPLAADGVFRRAEGARVLAPQVDIAVAAAGRESQRSSWWPARSSQQPWWDGFSGPGGWSFGPLTDSDDALWHESGRSFTVLAGLEWKLLMQAFAEAQTLIPAESWLELRYEDVIERPREQVQRLLLDLGLESTAELRAVVLPPSSSLPTAPASWTARWSGQRQCRCERSRHQRGGDRLCASVRPQSRCLVGRGLLDALRPGQLVPRRGGAGDAVSRLGVNSIRQA